MITHRFHALALATVLAAGGEAGALAPERPHPEASLAAQRETMAPFAFPEGEWRGPSSTTLPSGATRALVPTKRVGPFLGDTVKVIEERGHESDGRVSRVFSR